MEEGTSGPLRTHGHLPNPHPRRLSRRQHAKHAAPGAALLTQTVHRGHLSGWPLVETREPVLRADTPRLDMQASRQSSLSACAVPASTAPHDLEISLDPLLTR